MTKNKMMQGMPTTTNRYAAIAAMITRNRGMALRPARNESMRGRVAETLVVGGPGDHQRMSHHWTPLSMVSRSVRAGEWKVADRTEDLGWIRLVQYQGRPTYVCVTRSGWIVGGGDTLHDASEALLKWHRGGRDASPPKA